MTPYFFTLSSFSKITHLKKIITTLIGFAIFCQFNSSAQIALNFNGVNNVVTTNNAPVLNNQARTVDAWIKTTSTLTTQEVICDWGSMTVGQRFTLNMINSKLRIEVGGVGIVGTTNINTGNWTHVTAVYDPAISSGPNVFLYINGNLELSGNFTGYPTLTTAITSGLRIGQRNDGINLFQGSVDELKVYDYARTQAQVAADTVEYCGPQSGLVAYYKLNEGIPNGTNTGSITALDYSGYGYNGTLTSFTLSGTTSNWVTGRVRSSAPTITASPSANLCSGNTLTLTTNAVNNFTWSTNNTTSTLISVSPTANTVYSISTNNSQACTGTISINVNTLPPSVTVTAAQTSICLGASTSFTAIGASTYSWSGGIINGQAFSPTTTTNYTLVSGNGCGTVSSTHSILVSQLPITMVASPTIVCEGSISNLTASAAASSYSWLPTNQTGSTVVVAPQATTIYTVSASDGTCIGTQTIQLTTKTTPSISISNSVVTICQGASTSFTASGAGVNGSYSWAPGGSTNANVTVSPITNTVYTVIGTNVLGCSSSAQIPVIVISKPNFTVAATNTLVCNGQSVSVVATGAITYTWSTGANTNSISVTASPSISAYFVTATGSGNTCTATKTIAISVITPSISFTSSLNLCLGKTATLSASGANTYSWNGVSVGSNGQQTVNPNATTSYTLLANTQSLTTNCLSTYTATVNVLANPTVVVVASTPTLLCKGMSNALTASGAVTYTWSGIVTPTNQVIVSPNTTTTYTVIGTSADGCEATAYFQLKVVVCPGIKELSMQGHLNIHPNPSSGLFFMDSESEMNVEIYNLSGRHLKSLQIHVGENQIDVSELSPGIYVVASQLEGRTDMQKIIIQ